MSDKELSRLQAIERVKSKQMSQEQVAMQLGLSTRQLRRLTRAYERQGVVGLISRRSGKASNRRINGAIKTEVLSMIRTKYPDFGPTFAHEKLTEEHGFHLSVETLRQWMIEMGLWKGKKRRQARVHQQRQRRSQRGELVQIDGSPHAWFEKRGSICCLLVFIDDATSELLALHCISLSMNAYKVILIPLKNIYANMVDLWLIILINTVFSEYISKKQKQVMAKLNWDEL